MTSNVESGDGYSDILVELEEEGVGIVIEVKYAKNGDLEQVCREAMEQIERMGYEDSLLEDGLERVLKYGIACYKKNAGWRLLVSEPVNWISSAFSDVTVMTDRFSRTTWEPTVAVRPFVDSFDVIIST